MDISDGLINLSPSYLQDVGGNHTLSITAGPSGTPNPAASEGVAALSVTAKDSFGHAISYAWQASCPTLPDNGVFGPSASAQNPTWFAPVNASGTQQTCTITVTASDGLGLSATNSSSQAVSQTSARTYTYYFAEGATIGGFFETRLALLNLDTSNTANVRIDFQLKDSTTVLKDALVLQAQRRATLDVSTLGTLKPDLGTLASAEFSTVIRSDRPLVADRTMTWDKHGYGSHAETSIDAPASTWYLAEGATIGDFELYYLIQNPNPTPLTNEIEVTYLLPPPPRALVRTYSWAPTPGATSSSTPSPASRTPRSPPSSARPPTSPSSSSAPCISPPAASSTAPATSRPASARPPRSGSRRGRHRGLLRPLHSHWQPQPDRAQVTATFLFDDGTTCSTRVGSTVENGELVVGPKSRYNIWVDATTIPGCPELGQRRALHHDYRQSASGGRAEHVVAGPTAANWAEVHNAPGATTTGTRWALADGEQGGGRSTETYILIANTSAFDGTARVTLYFDDGSAPATKDVPLKANSRTNVPVGAAETDGGFGPAAANRKFGAVVKTCPWPAKPAPPRSSSSAPCTRTAPSPSSGPPAPSPRHEAAVALMEAGRARSCA